MFWDVTSRDGFIWFMILILYPPLLAKRKDATSSPERPKILVENPWKFPKTCWEKKWLMCNQWLLGFPRDFSGINIWWVQSFGVLWHSRKLEAYAQSRRSQLIVVSCYTRCLAFSVGLLGGDGLAIYWKGLIVNVLSFSSCRELLLQYYPPWSLT